MISKGSKTKGNLGPRVAAVFISALSKSERTTASEPGGVSAVWESAASRPVWRGLLNLTQRTPFVLITRNF